MLACTGFGTEAADQPLGLLHFDRREVGELDVQIEILFCGVCHSDLHYARNEWHFTVYPAVPGHEIVGRVASVGAGVTKYKAGDIVGVGCMVDSCRTCASCVEGLEQFCEAGSVQTFGSTEPVIGGPTHGGYSNQIVVDESFVLRIPEGMELAAAAPLLCAGITLYSPLRHWGAGPGKKVGIIGLGGLGHMGVKLSHAMGAHTVLFTTSPGKVEDGKNLGADELILLTGMRNREPHGRTEGEGGGADGERILPHDPLGALFEVLGLRARLTREHHRTLLRVVSPSMLAPRRHPDADCSARAARTRQRHGAEIDLEPDHAGLEIE